MPSRNEYGFAEVYPDTSRPVKSYAIRVDGKSVLRMEERLASKNLNDYKITELRGKHSPGRVYYELEVGYPLAHWVGVNDGEKQLVQEAGDIASDNTKLSMTDDGIYLVNNNNRIFSINRGIPMVSALESRDGVFRFNPKRETFSYTYAYRPPTRSTKARVDIVLAYDLTNIKKAYSAQIKYGSDAFYSTAREGLFAQIIVSPIHR